MVKHSLLKESKDDNVKKYYESGFVPNKLGLRRDNPAS